MSSIEILTLQDWGGVYAKGHHSLAEMKAALEADGRYAQLLREHDVRRTWWREDEGRRDWCAYCGNLDKHSEEEDLYESL